MPIPMSNRAPSTVLQGISTGSSENSHTSGLFACPFYKFNPVEHDECKRYQFKRISDVKQHIIRRHSLSRYSCIVCWVGFKDEASVLFHLQNHTCQPKPQPEKLSAEEINSLKLPRGGNPRDHWRAIWKSIFPGFPMPPSPFIQPNYIEEIKTIIWPSVEAAIHAGASSLLQSNMNEIQLASFLRFTLDSGCNIFCHSLPKSRHNPPLHSKEYLCSDEAHEEPLWAGDAMVSSLDLELEATGNGLSNVARPPLPFDTIHWC